MQNVRERMKGLSGFLTLAFVLSMTQLVYTGRAFGQQVKPHGDRKLASQLQPVYPPVARRLRLTGSVKLVAVVAPDGHVVKTEVLGGNPILVQSAADAVAKAKFQAGSHETKELIEISFQPDDE